MKFDATVGKARDHRIVSDHYDRPPLLVKLAQQPQDDLFVLRIEIAGGFIGQNNLRVIDQRSRDADSLLLASRKLPWQVAHAVAQPHAGQSFNRLFLIGHAVEVLRQHDVLDRGKKRNQVKLLEDESNLFRAHAIQFVRRNAGNVLAVEPDFAGCGAVEAANQIHQRRFTRPGGAHDGKPFALRDVQRDAVECMNGVVLTLLAIRALLPRALGGVEFGDVVDLNHFTLPSE